MLDIINKTPPWYYKCNYTLHNNIVSVLYQDTTNKTLHGIAISNHNKLRVENIRRGTFHFGKGYSFDITIGQIRYQYIYKINRNNQPLLKQKNCLFLY